MAEDIERNKLAKPARVKNKKLMTSYHTEQTCLLCWNPATPAHIKGRGAMGDDVPENMAPLCGLHHSMQGSLGMTTFSKRFPKFREWLLANGFELNFMDQWKKSTIKKENDK